MTMSQYEPPRPLEPDYGRRMTHAEAVILCRYAKAACPQQAFDEYTPDAWSDLLGDLRFEDAKEALRNVVKSQPFVAPAEIREEVKRVRNKRIGDFGPIPVPDGLTPDEYSRHMATMFRRIGDGELTRENYQAPELVARPDHIPPIEPAGTHVDEERRQYRRSVREAHEAAKRLLSEADEPDDLPKRPDATTTED